MAAIFRQSAGYVSKFYHFFVGVPAFWLVLSIVSLNILGSSKKICNCECSEGVASHVKNSAKCVSCCTAMVDEAKIRDCVKPLGGIDFKKCPNILLLETCVPQSDDSMNSKDLRGPEKLGSHGNGKRNNDTILTILVTVIVGCQLQC